MEKAKKINGKLIKAKGNLIIAKEKKVINK